MDQKKILGIVDHTLLGVAATWEEIKVILDDAMKYETASACIPAAYVKEAAEYVNGQLPICTVIGFPNGYSTTAAKVFETKDAIANGAEEIDMVINVGALKNKRYQYIEDEICAILLKIIGGCFFRSITCTSVGVLHDLDQTAGAQAISTQGDELLGIIKGRDAAGSFYFHICTNVFSHKCNVVKCCSAC